MKKGRKFIGGDPDRYPAKNHKISSEEVPETIRCCNRGSTKKRTLDRRLRVEVLKDLVIQGKTAHALSARGSRGFQKKNHFKKEQNLRRERTIHKRRKRQSSSSGGSDTPVKNGLRS